MNRLELAQKLDIASVNIANARKNSMTEYLAGWEASAVAEAAKLLKQGPCCCPSQQAVISHPDYIRTYTDPYGNPLVQRMKWDTRDMHVHLYSVATTLSGWDDMQDAVTMARAWAKHLGVEYLG